MMLGSQCSPCCGGTCQDFQSIIEEWNDNSSILRWSFSSTGFNTIPVFSAVDQEAYYTPSVPTFFRPGFYSVIEQGNARAQFMFAITNDVANVWTARYRLEDMTILNTIVTRDINFQCVAGTTLFTGPAVSSAVRIDNQTYSCCCAQHGNTVVFPFGNGNACDTTGFGNPNCDSAVNSNGQVKGICTRTSNPFGGFFESYTSFGYTMSIRLFDWRLFRTNPLP